MMLMTTGCVSFTATVIASRTCEGVVTKKPQAPHAFLVSTRCSYKKLTSAIISYRVSGLKAVDSNGFALPYVAALSPW